MGLRVRLSGIHPANHPLAELEPQPTSVGTGQFVGCHGACKDPYIIRPVVRFLGSLTELRLELRFLRCDL